MNFTLWCTSASSLRRSWAQGVLVERGEGPGLLERAPEAVLAAETGLGAPREDHLRALRPRLAPAAYLRDLLAQQSFGPPALLLRVLLERRALVLRTLPRPAHAVAEVARLLNGQAPDRANTARRFRGCGDMSALTKLRVKLNLV